MPWLSPSPASMPTARESLAAGVISGVLYAVGGRNASSYFATNEAYNPSTNTWSSKTSMPTARGYLAAGVVSGVLYAVGGYGGSYLATNEAYDPSTNTWSNKTGMPTARRALAAGVISGVLYAVGGRNASSYFATNEAYDPSTNTWSSKTSMPTARYSLAAGVVSSVLYAVGGVNSSGSHLATNEAYDPSTNTWSNKTGMPTARESLAAGVISGVLYAVGGRNASSYFATNEAYNPSTNTWSSKTSMPTARYSLAAGVVSSVLYAVGGVNSSGSHLATNEAYLEANPVSGAVALAGQSTVATTAGRVRQAACTFSGQSLLAARGSGPVPAQVTLAGRSSGVVQASRATVGRVSLAGASQLTSVGRRVTVARASLLGSSALGATAGRIRHNACSLTGSSRVEVIPAPPVPQLGPLRIDAGPPQGSPTVSVYPVLRCEVTWELNDVGAFSAQVPVTAPGAEQLDAGMEVRIIREGEGEIFRGLIASRRVVLEGDGPVVELEGYSTARELAWRTTQLNWRVQNQAVSTAVANLVAGTGWTSQVDSEVAGQLVTAEFQGVTRFEAIQSLAQQVYRHVRPMPVERRVEVTKGERQSGLRVVLPPEPIFETAYDTLVATRIRVSRRDEDIVTRVIPVGAGEGPNTLTLRWSNRTSPYPIRTMTGPDGSTLYYLEDTTASSTYGVRERVVAFKDVAPLANSSVELQRAANVLYDLAAAWLQARAQPRVEWSVEVAGPIRQRDPFTGNWLLLPGDKVRLTARGVVEDWDGKRVFVDLDTDAYVRGIERRFEGDAERIALTLTDSSRVVRDDDLLAEVIDRLWAQSVAQKVVPAPEIHGPFRQTGDGTRAVTLIVDWDANVRFLHRAILIVVCRRVRSNVQTTRSTDLVVVTSEEGGARTVTSRGGSGTQYATTSATAHRHTFAQSQNLTSWSDPGYREQVVWANSSAGVGYGVFVGRGNTTPANAELYGTYDGEHSHSVQVVIQDHTHTVDLPAHQHDVKIPGHNHGLQYGIWEENYPTGLSISVRINGADVTAMLGGPWTPSEGTPLKLDVTQFLQETDGRPRQQTNRIEVQPNKLVDIEVVLKSFVAVATIVPVGVT